MVTKRYNNEIEEVFSDSQGPASMGMMVEVRSGSESESMQKILFIDWETVHV